MDIAINLDKASLKKRLFRAIPLVFYALMIAFLYFYLRSIHWHDIFSAKFIIWPLIVSGVLEIFGRYFGIAIWLAILKSLGASGLLKNLSALMYAYSKAWLGRYIPGTAPWILGKIYFASKYGVSKHKLAVASLMEGSLEVGAVLTLSLVMLLLSSQLNVIKGDLRWVIVVALAVCVIAMIPKVFNWLLKIAYKVMRRGDKYDGEYVTGRIILKASALYALNAIVSGISLFFVSKALYPPLAYHSMIYIISVGNIAAAVSMLAIFVPSGIGVREGIFIVLLSAIMPREIALLIAVATRLWGVVMDLIFFAINWLIKLIRKPQVVATQT